MRQHYRVRWEIDLEAGSARDAAARALALQRDPRSVATVFEVVDAAGRRATFDLPGRAEASSLPGCPGASAGVGIVEESVHTDDTYR